jgi:polyhydroxybutyrate depolymerase
MISMLAMVLQCVTLLAVTNQPLGPGDCERTVHVNGVDRTYLVHVPPKYDSKRPTPVVLIYHGAFTNGAITVHFSGLNAKSDQAGFIALYPNGSGVGSTLFWNAGPNHFKLGDKPPPDDVAFTAKMLDDLESVANVDPKRIYATGISNGGMMCYRLAAELSDRIAAIAPVSGTTVIADPKPKRPVPVIHFHGLADKIVPFNGPDANTARMLVYKSVDDTIKLWVKIDGCPEKPQEVVQLPDKAHDGTSVTRTVYGPGKEGSEVVLYAIAGGGHTWPGRNLRIQFLGKSTLNISANDLIWKFFEKHPLP